MFPTLTDTLWRLAEAVRSGELPARTAVSLRVIFFAYFIGVLLAGLLTVFAVTTQIGTDFLEILTAMFNPLPAIALLWF